MLLDERMFYTKMLLSNIVLIFMEVDVIEGKIFSDEFVEQLVREHITRRLSFSVVK